MYVIIEDEGSNLFESYLKSSKLAVTNLYVKVAEKCQGVFSKNISYSTLTFKPKNIFK